MKYFDAHTHLNIQFNQDWKEVGERALAEGVGFVNVGADVPRSILAVEQAEYFASPKRFAEAGFASSERSAEATVFATVGIHPTDRDGDQDFEVIRELAKNPKVVAIGECGLEYFRIEDQAEKDRQRELFKKHIELALEAGKPVMIHCRPSKGTFDAYQDALVLLRDYKEKNEDLKFDMHFFTGDWQMAQKFLELGAFMSFNGVITFADQYDEVVRQIPLDRLMSETDAPFVAPAPHRGERNEPAHVRYVAERIAELRPEPREQVLEALVNNAKRFFGL